MRLSHFAQDALLSVIYRLEEIEPDELSVAEKNILETAHKYDRDRQPKTPECTCGEDAEAMMTLTSPQHSASCAVFGSVSSP